jgi:ABC-type Fe3+-hydroxamate transport system substrate-binding protein
MGRLSACRVGADRSETPAVARLRAEEAAAGIADPAFYSGFDSRVRAVVADFRAYLAEARVSGRRVAAFGAAAKGSTFLNAAGVTASDIVAVADSNPAKQGRLLPGSLVPIVSPDDLVQQQPDDIVCLPWNLAAELSADLRARGWRGRFVTAVPQLLIEQI